MRGKNKQEGEDPEGRANNHLAGQSVLQIYTYTEGTYFIIHSEKVGTLYRRDVSQPLSQIQCVLSDSITQHYTDRHIETNSQKLCVPDQFILKVHNQAGSSWDWP